MNRVALITGGTRGIGLGIAKALASNGVNLALCGVRSSESVMTTVEELKSKGVQVGYFKADLAIPEERKNLISAIERRFGHLEILINNAGVAPKERKDLLDATEDSFE